MHAHNGIVKGPLGATQMMQVQVYETVILRSDLICFKLLL